MNFDALESFRIFAETLNFTRAAEQRHLTQPALHKQVQNLTQDFGVDLYGKKGRSLFLTPAGHEVARFARQTRERLIDLQGTVEGKDSHLPITLAAGRGSYLYLLGQGIRAFQNRNPGALRIQVNDSSGTVEAVTRGVAHMGVTVLLEEPKGLDVTPLLDVAPHLVVAKHHPLSSRKSVVVADLDDLPMILPPQPSPLRDMVRNSIKEQNLRFNPVMEAPGWELAMHFASLGLGATIVNGCCIPPRQTKAIPLRGFPSTTYYLIERPSGQFLKAAKELRSCILKHAGSVTLFRT
ncbi:MAG: LysR family transcriptional regulator [Pseudomonadota bacterium]